MCLFITAVARNAHEVDALVSAARRHRIEFVSITNTHVERQLPSGAVYLEKRGAAGCDCGTILGSARGRRGSDDDALAREVEKRRKAGWSEAKLARWIASKQKGGAGGHATTRADEADAWLTFLRDALDGGSVSHVGLLLHFYRTSASTERVDLTRTEQLKLAAVDAGALARFDEDVLYLVVR